MNTEIEERLNGIEGIIHELHYNLQLMEYISYRLHKESFNLFNNSSLVWIWKTLMGGQLLDFYKLMNNNEKHSFQKLIHIAKDLNAEVNYDKLQEQLTDLIEAYNNTEFEKVRSKYLAHLDYNIPPIATEIKSINDFTQQINDVFIVFNKQFEKEPTEFSNDIIKSFDKIFDQRRILEKVGALCLGQVINGKNIVEISRLEEIMKEANDY